MRKSNSTLPHKKKLVPTQTISRAADILKVLNEGKLGVTAISKKVGIHKASVHRLLSSLEAKGFATKDLYSKEYCLGPVFLTLASNYIGGHQNLCMFAYSEMEHLWRLSGETVSLLIQVGMHAVCLEELGSTKSTKNVMGKGNILPLYAGSGKALLAQLPSDKLKVVLDNIQLDPLGPNTITDKDTLIAEIDKIRKLDHATSFNEKDAGGAGISVPIKNYVCPATLSIIGPESRLTPNIKSLLGSLKSSVERISERLLVEQKKFG
jgi:DNA-binding IclR family transcriptional regulator